MSALLQQPPGLARARAFLTEMRELSIDYSESVTQTCGQQPESVVVQVDAVTFDHLLADLETGERVHEMHLRLAEERYDDLFRTACAAICRYEAAEDLLVFERGAFMVSLLGGAVFLFIACAYAFRGAW